MIFDWSKVEADAPCFTLLFPKPILPSLPFQLLHPLPRWLCKLRSLSLKHKPNPKLDPSLSPREPADELTSAPSFTTMAAQTWIWTSLTVVVTVILTVVNANSEGDALFTLRKSLSDPDNVLQSWDPTLVNPCTWFHITCNQDNRVTRV